MSSQSLRDVRLLSIFVLVASLFSSVVADTPFYNDLKSYQDGKLGKKPTQSFHSSPIKAPVYQVNKLEVDGLDPLPYLFLTGRYGEKFGPSIVSAKDLSLIWADQSYDFAQAAQNYMFKGEPVLAVWAGNGIQIYNQYYEKLYSVEPQGALKGIAPDSHESYITSNDTVVMIVCPNKQVDLSVIGGPKVANVSDCHAQEIDPVTNEVLFDFATLDFFTVEDTHWPLRGKGVFDLGATAFDFCHMNSIEKTPEGDFLISYRHLDSIILVDGKTAKVKWTMGGKRNQFQDITEGGSAAFAYQHNPRLTGKNSFVMFDNWRLQTGFCTKGRCSRGLEVEFDPVNMTVQMIEEWYHPQSIISGSRGGIQRLPSGNTLIAWGQHPMYTEHTPSGEVVMDIQRGQVIADPHGLPAIIAYRAWKGDWEGRPTWGPNISANADESGNTKIYVSWNGATEVNEWVLFLSDDTADLDGSTLLAARSPRTGFETSFDLPRPAAFARIAAVNNKSEIIGSTPAVDIRSGTLHKLNYDILSVSDRNQKYKSGSKSASSQAPSVEENVSENKTMKDQNKTMKDPTTVLYAKATDVALAPFYAAVGLTIGLAFVLWRILRKRRSGRRNRRIVKAEGNEGLDNFRDERYS